MPVTWPVGPRCAQATTRAGTRHRGQTRQGNRWLPAAVIDAAHAARARGTSLAAQYRRLAAPWGQKERVAVGHLILGNTDHLRHDGEAYCDLGSTYFDERNRQALARDLVRRREALRHTGILEPAV
jgi:transposase